MITTYHHEHSCGIGKTGKPKELEWGNSGIRFRGGNRETGDEWSNIETKIK